MNCPNCKSENVSMAWADLGGIMRKCNECSTTFYIETKNKDPLYIYCLHNVKPVAGLPNAYVVIAKSNVHARDMLTLAVGTWEVTYLGEADPQHEEAIVLRSIAEA